MALFEVPGWAVSADPVADSPVTPSKKRKRAASSTESTQKIAASHITDNIGTQATPKKYGRSQKVKELLKLKQVDDKKARKRETLKTSISRPMPLGSTGAVKVHAPADEEEDTQSVVSSHRPGKRVKWSDTVDPKPTIPNPSTSNARNAISSGLTSLQKGMKESLNGARFRLINESLYKSDSKEAVDMMKENPRVYEEYHVGFRHQVQSWPTNPVKHYVSIFADYPARTCIADLGCGDAEMARTLIPKGIKVLSYDLVSDGEYVVETDICARIPLPGSEGSLDAPEKTVGGAHVVDVVVCALSLMGTNWPGCIREAWRILKPNGELHIAEVASRFTDVKEFTTLVSSIGFKLQQKDDKNTHFTLFEFVKIPRKPKTEQVWEQIMEAGTVLKPCEYKRR